ncbi:MAG: hypothetical protein LBR64_09120 [Dysgonamonadaceae bacterium]|jgi:hypothetical protein|nr:hypothetical protein [Dysgonamonadaceae bacterium]
MAKNKTNFLIFTALMMLVSSIVSGNNVEVRLPAFAGDTVYITAFRGAKQDTVAASALDKHGRAVLQIPDGQGLCFLTSGERLNLAFIRSDKEKIKITGESSLNEPLKIFDSPENDSINSWFRQYTEISEKISFWRFGLNIYKENEPQYALVKNEFSALDEAKNRLDNTVSTSPLYAARYLEIRNFLNERTAPLHEYAQDTAACEPFRRYLTDSLDMEALYASDMWFSTLNTATEIYRDLGNYQRRGVFWEYFADDMRQIYSRIRESGVKARFADDVKEICLKKGWKEVVF